MTPHTRSRRLPRKSLVTLGLLLAACQAPPPADGPLDHLFAAPTGAFRQISSYDTTGGNRDRLEIGAGDSAVLLDLEGPGVVRRIWITVASRDPHYLRRIALRMYWDGETTPSVAVPLGDFFGNGFDKRHYAALPMGVSSGGFYSYLPMPFTRRARVVVENGTGRPIDAFYYQIGVERWERAPRDLRAFHAEWRRTPRTDRGEPHLVLRALGRGAFVGLSLNAQSAARSLGFLEGDERFWVDGEFRGQGTGTEDYFNSGWYFDQGTFAAPYHGVVVKDGTLGRIAAYRWHVPDPVGFRDSIRIELEHGHANEAVADYATVAYWYQAEPHEPLPPLPPPGERRVPAVVPPPGAVMLEPGVAPAEGVELVVPVPRPDRYEVWVYPVGDPGAGWAALRAAGGALVRTVLDAPEEGERLPPVSLGEVPADSAVRITVTGDGVPLPAAIEARPVRRWVREWNVAGPFANPQLLGSEHSPAVDSAFGPERDAGLSVRYEDALGGPAEWRRVMAGPDGMVRLNPLFEPADWVAAYAQAFLLVPSPREVTLLLGADDAHVLWVDGARVSERQGRHISTADDVEIRMQLGAGWHRVLLKVADLDGGWAFQLRAADPEGALRWSAVAPR